MKLFQENAKPAQDHSGFLVFITLARPIQDVLQELTAHRHPFRVRSLPTTNEEEMIIHATPGEKPRFTLLVMPSLYADQEQALQAIHWYQHTSVRPTVSEFYLLELQNLPNEKINETFFKALKAENILQYHSYDLEKLESFKMVGPSLELG